MSQEANKQTDTEPLLDYCDMTDKLSQYDDVELKGIIDAIYRYPDYPEVDMDNPLICALPSPYTTNELVDREYSFMLPGYEPGRKVSDERAYVQIKALNLVRFPLPFHRKLERAFSDALIASYRNRDITFSDTMTVPYVAENVEDEAPCVTCGDSADATSGNFAMLGFGGVGKSSAISCLVKHYPQVLKHTVRNGHFIQIVYLVVNCAPNSNFSALYVAIGEAIDKALGNIVPVYEEAIDRARTDPQKLNLVRRYVELFSIGAIICDEVQLINFKGTHENTFESLLNLANRTKVAIILVGTEDAKDKLAQGLRMARRIGEPINASRYCGSPGFFRLLLDRLMYYQWFDEPVTVTDEIADVFFELSRGIVDQLITCYTCVAVDYLDQKEKPEVNAEYIRSVVTDRYASIQRILGDMDDRGLFEELRREVEDDLDARIQSDQMAQMIEAEPQAFNEQITLYDIVARIQSLVGDAFPPAAIEKAFKKVMRKKAAKDASRQELSKMVMDELYNAPKPKNGIVKADPIPPEQIDRFIDERRDA